MKGERSNGIEKVLLRLAVMLIAGAGIVLPALCARADEAAPAGHDPQTCTGFFQGGMDITRRDAGGNVVLFEFVPSSYLSGRWQAVNATCPEGYALYTLQAIYGYGAVSADKTSVTGQCCKVPAPDVLIEEHTVSATQCPDGYVVTGGTFEYPCPDCINVIRCTRVNLNRYQLGDPKAGIFWGRKAAFWFERNRIFWRELPAAIRFGASRPDIVSWNESGCVGQPAGSLLVGKKAGKRCHGYTFRELQFRGLAGDPPAGTPVKMFPDCDDIGDEYAHSTHCIRNRT